MEAGYSSETNRVDGMFNQGPFAGSPSGYFYNSPPPLKGALKSETACFTETSSEDSLAKKLNSLTNSLNQGKPINVEDIMSLRTSNETDSKAAQLLLELQTELRLAASSRLSGQLEPHLPVLNPPLSSGMNSGQKGHFDAHAVYAGDDAVSCGRWSQLATAGVRSALIALMSRYGLDTSDPSPTSNRASGKSLATLPYNISLPSTSSYSLFGA